MARLTVAFRNFNKLAQKKEKAMKIKRDELRSKAVFN
jgi:hypothetical protein